METSLGAAREARRFLTDRVRNDWTFPAPPLPFEHSDEELHGVSEFRERYYGTTAADEQEVDEKLAAAAAAAEDQGQPPSNGTGPYKFDAPDTVGQTIEARAAARAARRKRRRRRALEEEMRWNEGMAVFVRQRDAWTGAASVRKYARRRSRADEQMHPAELEAQRQIDAVLEETAVVAPLAPLAPPLLPHNSIRQSITPRAYPDIYAKIVVGGQTPKVPINLADMTRALVQGWKDDGEWPPKGSAPDPLMGKRRVQAGATGAKSFLAHHPHVKRGVESVKRVFRLSGHHHENGGGAAPGALEQGGAA
ncbi:uncharacterized protein K452DRAFT_229131 [Aplosporella prunicola CBS 121167]|uniref:Gag1-like clamp domain-containing protein n=1 Tax=Aplosporella prunicola CBS 121167 TaxID=1176127 RepID=A0A6A6BD51_9PEZI|nr:uncharacterized protein K452DRAFT_229131 [Aplosporella prunicola CBS 121167]KAF2141225.1 hypothetical protein K452DRAFT_229131 [Aplosporella prunicola CBS 121167]